MDLALSFNPNSDILRAFNVKTLSYTNVSPDKTITIRNNGGD